jgi:hypothetical protein
MADRTAFHTQQGRTRCETRRDRRPFQSWLGMMDGGSGNPIKCEENARAQRGVRQQAIA